MLSSLFVTPTVPTRIDPMTGVLGPDSRYWVRPTPIAAAAPTYGGMFIVHGEPGAPIPAEAVLTLHDGVTPWSWGDLLASHPLLQAFLLQCHWSEAGKPFNVGTKAQFVARGGLATLIRDNVAMHEYFGDGQ